MATIKQIDANRRNAQKSTGPTSVTGKAVSSMNALKTGLHAKTLVLPTEKVADLELLIEEHYAQHTPATAEARLLLDDLIHCEWELRRIRVAETQLWEYAVENKYKDKPQFPLGDAVGRYHVSFSKLQYRLDATRRACYRALAALKQLAADTPPAPVPPPEPEPLPAAPLVTETPATTSPEIGFVPASALPAPIPPAATRPDPPQPPAPTLKSLILL